jgi:hypothetical protein
MVTLSAMEEKSSAQKAKVFARSGRLLCRQPTGGLISSVRKEVIFEQIAF